MHIRQCADVKEEYSKAPIGFAPGTDYRRSQLVASIDLEKLTNVLQREVDFAENRQIDRIIYKTTGGGKIKMLDLIMKLLGYENINKIKIPEEYKRPKEIKLRAKKSFYKKYGILPEIILDKNNVLLDGFCSYYIAQVWNMTYVKIRRVKCQR